MLYEPQRQQLRQTLRHFKQHQSSLDEEFLPIQTASFPLSHPRAAPLAQSKTDPCAHLSLFYVEKVTRRGDWHDKMRVKKKGCQQIQGRGGMGVFGCGNDMLLGRAVVYNQYSKQKLEFVFQGTVSVVVVSGASPNFHEKALTRDCWLILSPNI